MEVITIQSESFKALIGKIDEVNNHLNKKEKEPKDKWLDNQELMLLLKISKRTAQHYRDTGLISFSQVGNKIYYKLSDVEQLLENYYNTANADRKIERREKRVYTETDLVSFGKYLLSEKRDNCFDRLQTNLPDLDFIEHKRNVHHADVENWNVVRFEEINDNYDGK